MHPRFWFYPWKAGYNGVRSLADKLDGNLILRENSRYKYRGGDIVVNWGSSTRPPVLEGIQVLNEFDKALNGRAYGNGCANVAGARD